jgi:uncharacterized protein YciI
MYFVVICHDKPDSSVLRASIRPSHLAYLTPYLDRIVFAGPLLADDSETSIGGLVVIECADLAAATAFAHADPYAVGGLFRSVEVRPWRKVFPASHS